MKTKQQYIAPELTSVSFRVEKGFVNSVQQNAFDQMLFWDSQDASEQVEAYEQHSIWNDGNGFWN